MTCFKKVPSSTHFLSIYSCFISSHLFLPVSSILPSFLCFLVFYLPPYLLHLLFPIFLPLFLRSVPLFSPYFFPILNSSSIYSFFTSSPCPHPILFPVSFFIPLWSYILFLLASFPTAHSFFPYHPRLLPLTLSALDHSPTFFISVSVLFVILTYPNPLFPFFHASLQYVFAIIHLFLSPSSFPPFLLSPLPLLLLNYLSLHSSVCSHPRSYPDARF